MKASFKRTVIVFKKVYQKPRYLIGAFVIALIVLLVAIWLPNTTLLKYSLFNSNLSFSSRVSFVWNGFAFLESNFTLAGRILTIASAILTGIALSLMVYYMQMRVSVARAASSSLIGMFASLLGVGCASCGAFLISAIFGIGAGTAFSALLPFNGVEFGWLGVGILIWSIWYTVKKIEEPLVCE